MCVRPADVRCQPTGCALSLYRSSRWGAPRLRAATSLPSLLARLFPSGAQSPTLSLPLAARTRPNALTLHPPAHSRKTERPIRLLRCSFAAPRFSLSAHRLRFPSRRGSCSSAVALAPPRFPPRAMRRAPIRLRSGVVGVRLSLKRPARKKLSLACGAKTINFQKYGLGLICEGFASLALQRPLAAVAIR